jgi:hypothetical protein
LVVWHTGSGTQTNMNVNEVISNRVIELSSVYSFHCTMKIMVYETKTNPITIKVFNNGNK